MNTAINVIDASSIFSPSNALPLSPAENYTLAIDEKCRRHLSPFVQRTFETLVPRNRFKGNWHIDLICEYLEAVRLGQIKKLIINEPPRFLKSLPVSIAFPAWVLGLEPQERFLCASYAQTLATEFSINTRRVMESEWYKRVFPNVRMAADQNQKTWFETTERGYRMSTSVGGSATGRGGNYKILDDPQDPERAFSAADTESALRWIDQVWSSRDDDPEKTREIVVMQRLAANDATKHLLDQGGWELLKIPQESPATVSHRFPISGKVHTRAAGDLIHHNYFGPDRVTEAKARLGEFGYAAQQQQDPMALGGNLIKEAWLKRYEALPPLSDLQEITLSIDTANKDKNTNAPTALGCFLKFTSFEGRNYLDDVVTRRMRYPELKRFLVDYVNSCGDKYGMLPTAILIEDKASGIQLIQDMQDEHAWPVLPIDPTGEGDKMVRLSVESPSIEAGHLWIPATAPWVFDYITELTGFPNVIFKDMVDMTSQYLKFTRRPREIFVG